MSEQEVEDLVGEVFARLAGADTPEHLQAYLATTARSVLSRRRQHRVTERDLRQKLLEEALRAEADNRGADHEERSDEEQSSARHEAVVAEVLRTVPPKEAQLLRLRFVAGLPVAQVARRVGCSRAAAYKRLERAIRRLRERYGVAPNPQKKTRSVKKFLSGM